MKLLIVVRHRFGLWNAPPWFVERIRAAFPELEALQFEDYQSALPHLPDADILVTWSLRPEQFALARRLRWIHSPAAAVHALMLPEIVASDVVITNARQVHGRVVAEHAMALVLALAKLLPSAVRHQQQHRWAQQQLWDEFPHPREVAGSTLGLIGAGSIGVEVARRALAFDMRVLVVREHPEKRIDLPTSAAPPADSVAVFGYSELDSVLPECDYVILAAPVTPKTRSLIDATRLSRMQPHACVINVARGALVDEPALIAALRARRIAGAALDVFEHEPLPADSPFWDLPNVLITPHTAALTERLWERHYDLLARNLRRFLDRQPLLDTVDKVRGY